MKNAFKGKHGPLLIAEIGGNHEGNFEYAKKLAQLAIESDVDYVKFQIYSGDSLVSKKESLDRNLHFKKFELTKQQHLYLADMILEAGIGYTSSVWDLEAMSWIDEKISLYKIGSGDVNAFPVIKKTAEKKKPIIISTGLSTEKEVLENIKFIQSIDEIYKDKKNLAILQCTSMYPIPFSDANLAVMNRLRDLTGLTIGYSDHTEGSKALQYAVAMGAEILEFHFTDDRRGKVFRDHKVSLTKNEISDLIQELKIIEDLKGHHIKKITKIEIENGHVSSFRRAVYPLKNIKKGETFTEENITVLRPNHGIDAKDYFNIIGKKATREIERFEKISNKDFI